MKKINKKGFSLVEILVASVILGLVVASIYAAFLSIVRLSNFSRNELEIMQTADSWLNEAKAGLAYEDIPAHTNLNINDITSICQYYPDINWLVCTENRVPSATLTATYTATENVSLGSPDYPFKKIETTVTWEERT